MGAAITLPFSVRWPIVRRAAVSAVQALPDISELYRPRGHAAYRLIGFSQYQRHYRITSTLQFSGLVRYSKFPR